MTYKELLSIPTLLHTWYCKTDTNCVTLVRIENDVRRLIYRKAYVYPSMDKQGFVIGKNCIMKPTTSAVSQITPQRISIKQQNCLISHCKFFSRTEWNTALSSAYTFYCFVIHLHTNIFKIRLKKQCARHRFKLPLLTLLTIFRTNFSSVSRLLKL